MAAACMAFSSCATQSGPSSLDVRVLAFAKADERRVERLEYPSFPRLPALEGRMASIVKEETGSFERDSAANWKAWNETATAEERSTRRQPHELVIVWKAASLGPRCVSILLEAYSYIGGAHGDTRLYSINYDPGKRRFIELGEVLENKGEDWLSRLATATRGELAAKTGGDPAADPLFLEGSAPRPENYSCFTFDEDSLTIHFQRYQVGPGSAGTPSVTLPRDLDSSDYSRR
jgi:hypothetical protein